MNKWSKRFLSILLAISMMLPTTTFALDEEAPTNSDEPEISQEQPGDEMDEDESIDEENEIGGGVSEDDTDEQGEVDEEEQEEIVIDVNDFKDDLFTFVNVDGEEPTDGPVNSYRDFSVDRNLGAVKGPFSAHKGTFPSSYSLVALNRVTSVKNQGSYGTCWSFATAAAAESSAITQGFATKNDIDLSELQIAYFVYNRTNDPLGLTEGDTNILTKGFDLDVGGNVFLASMDYAGGLGFIDEKLLSYTKKASEVNSGVYEPDESLAYSSNSYITNEIIWLDMKTDVDSIKQLLMEKGAMAVSYYHENTYLSADEGSYYCPFDKGTNHAVTLVGWDDTYSRYNFGPSYRPKKDGAWLIKNSWGNAWGRDGYFYISYEDYNLNHHSKAVVINTEVANPDTSLYQYDGTFAYSYLPLILTNKMYEANVFTAQEYEMLNRVGFFTIENDVTDYRIWIYKNVKDTPTSGEMVASKSGTLGYTGYHTVDLDDAIALMPGEKFAVVVETTNTGGNAYSLIDCSEDYNWVKTKSYASKGQSFLSADGERWEDISADGKSNLRVKAYTTKGECIQSMTLATSDGKNIYNVGDTFQLITTTNPVDCKEPIDYYYSRSDESEGDVTIYEDGTVSCDAPGTLTIYATSSKANASIDITILAPIIDLEIEEDTLFFGHIGTTKRIEASTLPYNTTDDPTITYKTNNPKVVEVSEFGDVTSIGIGETTIEVSTTNGITKTVYVTVAANRYETEDGMQIPELRLIDTYYTINAIAWTYDEYADSYCVYRSTDGKKWKLYYTNDHTDSYLVDDVSFNSTYYYKVKSLYTRENGEELESSYSNVIKVKNYLSTPTLEVESSYGDLVFWSQIIGASGYEVYRATSKTGKYTKVKTASSKTFSFKDTKLTPGKTYYYKVRAYRTVGRTKVYSKYSAVTSYKAGPAKVTGLKYSSLNYGSFRLTWTKAKGAKYYLVQTYDTKAQKWVDLAIEDTNSYTHTTSEEEAAELFYQNRKYRVISIDSTVEKTGLVSNSIYGKTLLNKTTVTTTKYGVGAISVKWSNVKGADGYQVQRKIGSKGTWKTVSTQSGKTYIDKALKIGSDYYYRVRAYRYDANGNKVYASYSSTVKRTASGFTMYKNKYPIMISSYNGRNYMSVTSVSSKVLGYLDGGDGVQVKVTIKTKYCMINDPTDSFVLVTVKPDYSNGILWGYTPNLRYGYSSNVTIYGTFNFSTLDQYDITYYLMDVAYHS